MPRASQAETTLGRWWSQLFADRAADPPSSEAARAALDELLARHREPHRHYHTAAHVEWTLRHIDELARDVPVHDRPAVMAAAFFHDAIYDPRADRPGANELASAELAARRLRELGWSPGRTDRVHAMIVATASHDAPERGADTAVLLDADLAVLGADTSGYSTYVNGVRAEYRHVDADGWRAGRTAVLDDLLARDTIYTTEPGKRRWEARARANLTAERASLVG